MTKAKEMSDEEFVEFINANKERLSALMNEDKGLKTFIKENAKKAKKKAEEAADATEESVKKVVSAMFSQEVQKHMIGAGIELMLGFGAILKAMPVPQKAEPIIDKMAEVRRNAQSAYCSVNPSCPRKKSEAKIETKKIELD